MVAIGRKNRKAKRRRQRTPSLQRAQQRGARDTHYGFRLRDLNWKDIFDRALAVVFLIPGLPTIGVLVAIVRMTSAGPGLFRQVRVGKDGRNFEIYKIRTMIHNAEARTGPIWSTADDPRVTFVGRVLRKYHLDELPQLFNILRGEMSFVGPRPERPEFVYVLATKIPSYYNRGAVKPGVTGLAQLNLPPDTDLASVRRKLVLDLEYLELATFQLDVRIILCTVLRAAKLSENRVLRLFGLVRSVDERQLALTCCVLGSRWAKAGHLPMASRPPYFAHPNAVTKGAYVNSLIDSLVDVVEPDPKESRRRLKPR